MTASKSIQVCFFRNVLRVHDNQSLFHALKAKPGADILPVVCIDPRMTDISNLKNQGDNAAPKTWFFKLDRVKAFRSRFYYESIMDLKQQLVNRGSDLMILFGRPEEVFPRLEKYLATKKYQLENVHAPKEYAYEELLIEKDLSKSMKGNVKYYHDSMMVHPDDLDFVGERTYKVYTHFRKRIEKMDHPVRAPLDMPEKLPAFPQVAWDFEHAKDGYKSLEELYKDIHVKKDSRSAYPWKGGEQSALDRLNSYVFKTHAVDEYKHTRNGMIGTEYSTKFSAFLAHGCLSPRLIWHQMDKFNQQRKRKRSVKAGGDDDGIYWVRFELLWRDFFRLLAAGYGSRIFMLHGFRNMEKPEIAKEDDKKHVDEKPKPKNSYTDKVWRSDDDQFSKWCNGQTGTPFVDACMRELLYTGFLNNRGRQNVASYLAKDLEIDWRIGAEYFESMLLDHDVYSNYGNWQYVAGVGCDPREGFRHFNIIKQGKDYDADGDYIKLWCPELEHLPTHFIHCPWLMTKEDQAKYKCQIGSDYPEPMALFDTWIKHYPAAATNGAITNYFQDNKKKVKTEKK
ncbi:mitochondrial 54S ribosomal protein YmL35 [Mucor velutinosus]|uniref:Cryptochrome DASH n=1 Tax=Mucor velutinosus TaxID=708070 RepID=A0AAN7DQ21_9FUNG|nr:mitochondrial 54S ribosomal protein YmL35 [Mucor velutinosus]